MADMERLAGWLQGSDYITLFSGAGMATESGSIHEFPNDIAKCRGELPGSIGRSIHA